ncbi:hypothetical protein EV126DRAFT_493822, partial [Verticillium dahliae]
GPKYANLWSNINTCTLLSDPAARRICLSECPCSGVYKNRAARTPPTCPVATMHKLATLTFGLLLALAAQALFFTGPSVEQKLDLSSTVQIEWSTGPLSPLHARYQLLDLGFLALDYSKDRLLHQPLIYGFGNHSWSWDPSQGNISFLSVIEKESRRTGDEAWRDYRFQAIIKKEDSSDSLEIWSQAYGIEKYPFEEAGANIAMPPKALLLAVSSGVMISLLLS